MPWKLSNRNIFPHLLYCLWSFPLGMLHFSSPATIAQPQCASALPLAHKSHNFPLDVAWQLWGEWGQSDVPMENWRMCDPHAVPCTSPGAVPSYKDLPQDGWNVRARRTGALQGKEEVRCPLEGAMHFTPCLQVSLFCRPWVTTLQISLLGIVAMKTSPLTYKSCLPAELFSVKCMTN